MRETSCCGMNQRHKHEKSEVRGEWSAKGWVVKNRNEIARKDEARIIGKEGGNRG